MHPTFLPFLLPFLLVSLSSIFTGLSLAIPIQDGNGILKASEQFIHSLTKNGSSDPTANLHNITQPPMKDSILTDAKEEIAMSLLVAHNLIRITHGTPVLGWSRTLARDAQRWADKCQLQRSNGSGSKYGELIAAGTGHFSVPDVMDLWTAEESQDTIHIGCAIAICNHMFNPNFGPATYYVCEYDPPGNVIGEFPLNVNVTR